MIYPNPCLSPIDCVHRRHSFMATSAGQPIHVWDAYHGKIIQTFKGYDQYFEMISALSIAIDPQCTKVFAGYNKTIKVFDIERADQIDQISTCGQSGRTILNLLNFLRSSLD